MSISQNTANIILDLCEEHCPQSDSCTQYCETALALRKAIEYPIDDALLTMQAKPYPDEM